VRPCAAQRGRIDAEPLEERGRQGLHVGLGRPRFGRCTPDRRGLDSRRLNLGHRPGRLLDVLGHDAAVRAGALDLRVVDAARLGKFAGVR